MDNLKSGLIYCKSNPDQDDEDGEKIDALLKDIRSSLNSDRRAQPQRARSCPERDADGFVIARPPRKKPCRRNRAPASPNPGTSDGVPAVEHSVRVPHPGTSDDVPAVEHSVEDIDIQKELEKLLEQLDGELTHETSWHTRRHKVLGQWDDVHEHLVKCLTEDLAPEKSHNCSFCNSRATITCRNCPGKQMCGECDKRQHQYEPLHDRYVTIDTEYKTPLPCGSIQSPDGSFKRDAQYLSVLDKDKVCTACGTSSWRFSGQGFSHHFGEVIVISLKGRYDAFLPCQQCTQCHFVLNPTMGNLIRYGFWPGSPTVTQGMYLYQRDVIELFDLLKKEKPTLSVHSFLSTLELISFNHKRMNVINPTTFYDAVREWRRCRLEMEKEAEAIPSECTACGLEPHAVHVDGNKKLYRYRRANQVQKNAYTENHFMCADAKVNTFVNSSRDLSTSTVTSTCGGSHFQAARTRSKGIKSLDETGICTACCRHCVILRGLNMYQGEIFSYPLYILYDMVSQGYTLRYVCQDIICKFWPWLQRFADIKKDDSTVQALKGVQPFLGVMHGKAHDWACQILWGGRWQGGSGIMTGEEMEMCFAYLSLVGHTTKMMSKSSREDEITEHVFHWNRKKIQNMTKTLTQKYVKTMRQLEANSQVSSSTPRETVEQWKSHLISVATEKKGPQEAPISPAEDSFIAWAQNLPEMDKLTKLLVENAVTANRPTRSAPEPSLLEEGKTDCALRLEAKLQDECSAVHAAILNHTYNIGKLADGCKQRHAIRRKRNIEKTCLHAKVEKLNVLAGFLPGREQISAIQEASGEWPWLSNSSDDSVPVREKRDCIDKQELMDRWMEEKNLLLREMRNHVGSLQRKRNSLVQRKSRLPSEDRTSIALLASGIDSIEWLLQEAITTFRRVTSGSVQLGDDEDEDEDEGASESVALKQEVGSLDGMESDEEYEEEEDIIE